ncbi:MAG: transporter substrate-binding domain-containing protein [Spirochaetia bacterium]|nr:transporter substrate-binding domain-containing protein [Spirochaetia bacterium]
MSIKRNVILLMLAAMIMLPGCSRDEKISGTDFGNFDGKRIGVLTGSVFDGVAQKYLRDPQISYYNSNADIAIALEKGKIDAYVNDEPVWRLLSCEYPEQKVVTQFSTEEYAFIFKKGDEKSAMLCRQMNEFLDRCRNDGTLKQMDSTWFGDDESVKFINMDGLTGKNGILSFVTTTDIGAPFAYMKDNHFAGYDIDLAVRFCREYGYGIGISNNTFAGMVASVSSGKSDFGAACITITDERKKSMLFSDADYIGGNVLVSIDGRNTGPVTSVEQLAGTRTGVMASTIFDGIADRYLPDCKVEYFNTSADLPVALEGGKISSYISDEPIVRSMITNTWHTHRILKILETCDYAFILPKDNKRSEKLCVEINEFLRKCRSDGTLDELEDIWLGSDVSKQKIDRSGLVDRRGTLTFATSTATGKPFAYMQDNEYVGYDVDLAVRFCTAYGYDLNIVDYDFSGLFSCVAGGKCDFGASGITVTEERRENMLFTDPDYIGGSVLVVKGPDDPNRITSVEQLRGTRTAVLTGTISDTFAWNHIPDCEVEYYNTSADLSVALETGKTSSYVTDEPIARVMMGSYPKHRILEMLEYYNYAFALPKNKPNSKKLCAELNEFLKRCSLDGTLDEVRDIWLGSDVSKQKIDRSGLVDRRGTLTFATSTATGKPFAYMQDNEYVGYDVDLAVRFCTAYGYDLNIVDYDFSGLFSCVAGGKCDFGASGITVTEERRENMLFTDPNYIGGSVLVVKDEYSTVSAGNHFFSSLRDSFDRTFIRESRYLLFLSGIGTTLLIVMLALVFGSLIGFTVYMIYYHSGRVFRIFVDAIIRITENTPVVVILMILYYVIFGSVGISGIMVSVIGFTLIFSMSVVGLLEVGVGAVDVGQREAALALGYTENKAFMRMVLPQAAKHFLPGYKSAIVQLVKGTAIVGYIAVQDLTKVSDIVRSRTYEAFFPLVVTAIIYFIICMLLASAVRCIEINVDPGSRKKINILMERKANDRNT